MERLCVRLTSSLTLLSFDALTRGSAENIRSILQYEYAYNLVRSFTRSWENSGYLKTLGSPWIRRIRRSRSCKVVDLGTNRKRICDFLLVRHSNTGPILYLFGDIAGCCTPEWPHPYSTLIFGVFPLHQIAHVGVSPRKGLKLVGREIIFEEFQRMWSRYLNVTDGQTDGQTIYWWHNRFA